MKKYIKPVLNFENYELSHHIAACTYDLNAMDVMNCFSNIIDNSDPMFSGAVIGNLFVEGNDACTTISETYCYTNNTSTVGVVFNS